MKSSRILLCLALLAAAAPAFAQFESARMAPGNALPQYPASLTLSGITKGHAVVALSIDMEGKVQDALVLAYTQPQFARATLDVVNQWTFVPARLDGGPIPVRLELRFDYSLEGAVISSNVAHHFMFDGFDAMGDNEIVYQPKRADQLDQPIIKVAGEAPLYPMKALKAGIQGRVEVHFYIDERGEVRLPAVSSGSNLYLMEQAVAAVRNWKFAPPTSNGRPVLVAASQEFDFGGVR